MRQTNQQKWNEAQSVLSAKKEAFINETFEGKEKPKIIYEATINGIDSIHVNSIKVWDKEPHCYKKPTNKDISDLWNFIDTFENQEKTIGLSYTREYETYSSSGAFKLSEIGIGRLSFNHDDLIPIHKELNEKYAPREGYKPCAYCGKQVPENTLVPYEIVFQDSRPDPFSRHGYKRFVNQKTNMYCSKTCGVHDQMAHEG